MFKVELNTDNAAFDDMPRSEIARILGELAEKIQDGGYQGYLYDFNGNRVGDWVYVPTED